MTIAQKLLIISELLQEQIDKYPVPPLKLTKALVLVNEIKDSIHKQKKNITELKRIPTHPDTREKIQRS
jgi:hypothetical protein